MNHLNLPSPDTTDRDALKILIGGMLGMIVAMGIGRFAFTPILPLMQRDLAMSNTVAGGLAGLNYLGYLVGAVGCSFLPQMLRSRTINGSALLISLATTLFMGMTLSNFWWGVMRFGGGVASALLFIVITAEVAEALAKRGFGHWIGALYGGIGVGIAASGLFVPLLDHLSGWSGAWTGMGVLAILCAVSGVTLGRRRNLAQPVSISTTQTKGHLSNLRILAVAYFFEGLGYIVTATFIVAIIAVTPGLEAFAPYSWVAVGIAAVPSTIFWPYLARRIGARKALLFAYGIQATGILVSIGADNILEVLFAAISFGSTFLGIVAMTLAEGSRRAQKDSRRAAAILTTCFSVGQMLGPILAGFLADIQEGFSLPLLLAACAVIIGGILIAVDNKFCKHSEQEA